MSHHTEQGWSSNTVDERTSEAPALVKRYLQHRQALGNLKHRLARCFLEVNPLKISEIDVILEKMRAANVSEVFLFSRLNVKYQDVGSLFLRQQLHFAICAQDLIEWVSSVFSAAEGNAIIAAARKRGSMVDVLRDGVFLCRIAGLTYRKIPQPWIEEELAAMPPEELQSRELSQGFEGQSEPSAQLSVANRLGTLNGSQSSSSSSPRGSVSSRPQYGGNNPIETEAGTQSEAHVQSPVGTSGKHYFDASENINKFVYFCHENLGWKHLAGASDRLFETSDLLDGRNDELVIHRLLWVTLRMFHEGLLDTPPPQAAIHEFGSFFSSGPQLREVFPAPDPTVGIALIQSQLSAMSNEIKTTISYDQSRFILELKHPVEHPAAIELPVCVLQGCLVVRQGAIWELLGRVVQQYVKAWDGVVWRFPFVDVAKSQISDIQVDPSPLPVHHRTMSGRPITPMVASSSPLATPTPTPLTQSFANARRGEDLSERLSPPSPSRMNKPAHLDPNKVRPPLAPSVDSSLAPSMAPSPQRGSAIAPGQPHTQPYGSGSASSSLLSVQGGYAPHHSGGPVPIAGPGAPPTPPSSSLTTNPEITVSGNASFGHGMQPTTSYANTPAIGGPPLTSSATRRILVSKSSASLTQDYDVLSRQSTEQNIGGSSAPTIDNATNAPTVLSHISATVDVSEATNSQGSSPLLKQTSSAFLTSFGSFLGDAGEGSDTFDIEFVDGPDFTADGSFGSEGATRTVRVAPNCRGVLVGRGAYGSVFVGMDIGTGQSVAVKVIPLQFDVCSKQHKLRMEAAEREVALLSSFQHRNVISCLGACITNAQCLCIAMEYASGGTLLSMLEKFAPIPVNLAHKHITEIAAGLMYLHSKGVIHRDLKTENILLRGDGTVAIADFGCSKSVAAVAMGSKLVGTVKYMAPEVLNTEEYSELSDVWAFACCVVELCLGAPPWFESDKTLDVQLMWHIAHTEEMPFSEQHLSYLETSIRNLVVSCFERDVQRRPSLNQAMKRFENETL